ncbi:hypothetical protein C8D87_105554 [Lentzea atacamensis]|uniref:Uncharacterized protein n=1 Tax=Lentzea atacamensis TaxID=531938 RepID=A0ABX9E9C3_9PSEU|nr:hypothetical protein C8D87_105554 [Lentzea atacamensis]
MHETGHHGQVREALQDFGSLSAFVGVEQREHELGDRLGDLTPARVVQRFVQQGDELVVQLDRGECVEHLPHRVVARGLHRFAGQVGDDDVRPAQWQVEPFLDNFRNGERQTEPRDPPECFSAATRIGQDQCGAGKAGDPLVPHHNGIMEGPARRFRSRRREQCLELGHRVVTSHEPNTAAGTTSR